MGVKGIKVEQYGFEWAGGLPGVGVKGLIVVIPGLLDRIDGELLLKVQVGPLAFHYLLHVTPPHRVVNLPPLAGDVQVFCAHQFH